MAPELVSLMSLVTYFGNAALWIFISLALFWLGREKSSKFFIAALLIDVILNKVLKYSFLLPRPPREEWLISVEDPYGFPSGHSETAFLASTFLTLEDKRMAFLYVIASLVGYSRIALGVHYLLDVVGGSVIGVIIAALVWMFKERQRFKLTNRVRVLAIAFSFMFGLLLFSYFPVRPELMGGFTSGFGVSVALGAEFKRSEKVYLRAIVGCASVLMIFLVYSVSGNAFVKAFSAFMAAAWSLTIYPRLCS